MCNPRKVMIHLARSIENAWRRTVEQTALVSGEVKELNRITAEVQLDEEMGSMALEMLEQVLEQGFEGFEPWQRDSLGDFRRNLGQVTLIFSPHTRRLYVESQLTELVTAESRAAAELCGFTVGEVSVEAVGRYYEDGWGGRTRERALEEAQASAEHRLEEAIEALHRQQNVEAFAAAETKAQAEAQEHARRQLQERQAEVRNAMREKLQYILSQAEDQVHRVMNRAVGEAYRRTLLRLVNENGGRIISDQKTGNVINMELELY